MENKIILTATAELKDEELRQEVARLRRQIENINDRTKKQTLEIRELQKMTEKYINNDSLNKVK